MAVLSRSQSRFPISLFFCAVTLSFTTNTHTHTHTYKKQTYKNPHRDRHTKMQLQQMEVCRLPTQTVALSFLCLLFILCSHFQPVLSLCSTGSLSLFQVCVRVYFLSSLSCLLSSFHPSLISLPSSRTRRRQRSVSRQRTQQPFLVTMDYNLLPRETEMED